jgi:hypothetical protein
MKKKIKLIWIIVMVGMLSFSSKASLGQSQEQVLAGTVTPILQYQGRLTNPTTGEPVTDGLYSMGFYLFDVDTDGTALWSESKSVTVQHGLFSTILGDTNALHQSLFNGQALWLEITVGGERLGPRQPVLAVP